MLITNMHYPIFNIMSGVFTFFVLYDHFHHPHSAINQAFTADTYLFIMLSGIHHTHLSRCPSPSC